MKLKSFILTFFIFTILTSGYSQNNIVINDQLGYLNDNIDNILVQKFEKNGLKYSFSINMKTPCDYYYVDLSKNEGASYLSIKNCKTQILGSLKLLQNTKGYDDNDFASLIYFKIMDIIENPFVFSTGKNEVVEEKATEYVEKTEKVVVENKTTADQNPEIDPTSNQHDSRYFFSPSSYNLKKGDLYYNSIYFLLHDLQYGVTDNFSIGMGTSIAGMPFYLTPKLSIPVNERNHFAVGDMLMLGTYGVNFVANLAYATYTYGSQTNNFTLGIGYFSTNEGDLFNQKFNNPVVSFSAMAKLSNYMYFITENYYIYYNGVNTATFNDQVWDYSTNPPTVTGSYYTEDFDLSNNLFLGFTGFRFINKAKDVISWQVGLAYFANAKEEIPSKYTGSYWWTNANNRTNQLMIPSISYTQKFGQKY